MNDDPKVTIVIPAYNQANYLPTAIESALAQNYENVEIVVSDDCSTDNTGDLIKKYINDKRVRYFRNESNCGRVANYRHTLENRTTGEWVVNLDADDYFTDPSFISRAIKYIHSYGTEKVVFVQAGHAVKTPNGKTIRVDIPDIKGDVEIMDGTDYFLNFNHFSHLASIFNRALALSLEFYRYNILSSDIESFLRLSLHGKVILMRETVGVWVHHGANESQRLSIPAVEMNMIRIESPYVYAKSLNTFSDGTLLRWRNQMTQQYLQSYLIKSLKSRNTLNGYLWHILKYYPQAMLSWMIPKAIFYAVASRIVRFFGIKK